VTEISVIIPARNAAEGIGRTVEAAVAQSLEAEHEVIVVDDGSSDGTAEIAERAGARVLRNHEPLGPADARNAGVAAARGRLLAFTDSDCVPQQGWLAAGAAALEDGADLVQGRVVPDPDTPIGPFDHTINVAFETLFYETANLFVTREYFEQAGGFKPFIDPAAGHFGEDVMFAWAARRAGARAGFAPEAVVQHDVVARPASAWVRERLRLRYFPRITKQVPELRERFVLGVFLSRKTAFFDLALLGVLLAARRRSAWPLLLALPYLRMPMFRRDVYRRWVLKQNLQLVLGDVVGFGSLVRGSVTERTPVL
jgi:glycosyltransferase involved in cell wall biosynthesis